MSVAGYTRQSSAEIVNGLVGNASDFNNEFNSILGAMSASAGHTHDGTTGGGQPFTTASMAGFSSSTAGIVAATGAGGWAARTLTGPTYGITVSNGTGVSGNPTLTLANSLSALQVIGTAGTAGLLGFSAVDTLISYTLTPPTYGLSITSGGSVITFALANTLSALQLLGTSGAGSNGIAVLTNTDTWAVTSLTAPSAGITIANPSGVGGSPTFALANSLAALQTIGTAGTAGFYAITGTDTAAIRTFSSSTLTLTNANGTSGNPTINLTSGIVSSGTYTSVTVDTYGRVTAGSSPGSTITLSGDISGSGTASITTTLATVCASPGTGTKATVNGKGLTTAITSATLASADFANQGTTTTLLIGNASGNPSFGSVNLATMVTGNLAVGSLNSGSGATSSTYWRGDGSWASLPLDNFSGQYYEVGELQTSGTNSSTSLTSVTWTKITLQEISSRPSWISAFSSSQFTVGTTSTYDIQGFFTVPMDGGGTHGQIRLRNTTDSTTTLVGASVAVGYSSSSGQFVCQLNGRVTLTAAKVYEIDGWSNSLHLNPIAGSTGEQECYARFKIIQV